MNEFDVAAARIELLNDLIKIGIPSLIAILSGLIPYFIEKRKETFKVKQEAISFRREKMSELVEALSIYSGCMYRHLSLVKRSASSKLEDYPSLEDYEKSYQGAIESGLDLLENDYRLKKAKAISGLLGVEDLSNSIECYENKARETLKNIIDNIANENFDLETIAEDYKNSERSMLKKLNALMDN